MLSRCCIGLTCSCEQVIRACELGGETRDASHCFKEDRTEAFEEPSRMDIASLKEQYLWIKEKQKYQTRVVFFKKAPNNEEICGKSLVNMVPVNQDIRNPKAFEEQLPVKEIQYNFVDDLDNDKTPWRTHLGIYRMTHPGSWIQASDTNVSRPAPNPITNLTATKDFCKCTGESQGAESITSEKCHGPQCLESKDKSEQVTPASRKSYFPKALSRQHSVAEHRPSLTLNSHHYPFPQWKCQKKSEAARRLGMYSSF